MLQQVNLNGLPVLIVDDEADQAGLNNLINQGQESTTYQHLCTLKNIVPHHTFLQYTATPQGPLLINLIDVLSPSFAVTLTPGPDYTGGRDFFLGPAPLGGSFRPANTIGGQRYCTSLLIHSLKHSACFFSVWHRGPFAIKRMGNGSMMVHPSQRTVPHQQYFDWVTNVATAWRHILETTADDDPDRIELLAEFRHSYDDLAATVAHLEPFEELTAQFLRAIRLTDIHLVNAVPGETPQIDWRGSYAHILVGGQALDRGYTVEGLTVTYMPRGVGARRADTIQQRARFFGYKRPYLGYCRVFVEHEVAEAFTRYVRHEDDIRQQITEMAQQGRSLDELRRTSCYPKVWVPRATQSSISITSEHGSTKAGSTRAPQESPLNGATNRDIVVAFLDSLDLVETEGHPDRSPHQRHRWATEVPLQVRTSNCSSI